MRKAIAALVALLAVARASEPVATLEGRFVHAERLRAVRFLGDRALRALAEDGIHEWELPSGRERKRLDAPPIQGTPYFSADGDFLIDVTRTRIFVHELDPSRLVGFYESFPDERIIAASPDGKFVGVHDRLTDATFAIELATGKHRLVPGGRRPGTIAISPGGERIACVDDGSVTIIDAGGTRVVDDDEDVRTVAFSLDGKVLAAITLEHVVRWDARTKAFLSREDRLGALAHRNLWTYPPRSFPFGQSSETTSSYVVTRDELFHVDDVEQKRDLFLASEPAHHLLWKGSTLVTVGPRGSVEWVDGAPRPFSGALSPDLAAGRALLNQEVGPEIAKEFRRIGALDAALSPDGKWLALARRPSVVVDWRNPSTWNVKVTRDPGNAHAVTWGPAIAFALDDRIDFYDIRSGEKVKSLDGHVERLAFTRTGELVTLERRVLTLHAKGTLKVKARIPADAFAVGPRGLAVARGRTIALEHRLLETPSPVVALAFSPDGRLFSSHVDAAIRIWEPGD